jgi:type IX secretion system PorP/SprF family membrane protein
MFFNYLRILFFLISSSVIAQDIHLTQYYTSNMSLNPAYTGHYDGDVRITGNSRSQWSQVNSSIKTNILSVEKKFHVFPNEIGVGVMFVNDQVSALFLHTNKALASLSYQMKVGKNLIRVGAQGGVTMRNIQLDGQTFPEQWNYSTGSYESSSSSGEVNLKTSWMLPSVNAGLSWSRTFGRTPITLGYGLYNINKPKDQFVSNIEATPFRHVLNGTTTLYISPRTWVTPQLLYMQMAKALNMLALANVNHKFNDRLTAYIGGGMRGSSTNGDAAIAVLGAQINRLAVGFSWDFNISSLSKNSKYKSAWEISISYTTPSRAHGKVTIPCDRY